MLGCQALKHACQIPLRSHDMLLFPFPVVFMRALVAYDISILLSECRTSFGAITRYQGSSARLAFSVPAGVF